MNSLGLYIHIPFCKYICKYCDFCKKYKNTYDNDKYIELLLKELDMYKNDFKKIDSIYIGGGTPSSLDFKLLEKLLSYVKKNIDLNKVKEYTIEANPDDINQDLVNLLYEKKVSRVSLGVQSLNDNILLDVKREHTKNDVQKAIDLLSLKIKNISVDFIFNLPNQTIRDIDDTFLFLKKNHDKIQHVSYYSLILEENTMLYNEKFIGFDEEIEDDVYKKIQYNLKELEYEQYEISNFSKKNFNSYHNKKYWELNEYIGVGLSASSYINDNRYTTTRSFNEYESFINKGSLAIINKEYINSKEKNKERIIFGLRTNKGIKNNIKVNEKILKFLEIEEDNIRIKKEYLFLSNIIILELLELNDK